MTATDVVNASKVALVNFDSRYVVVTCNSVCGWVALDQTSLAAPKLSIFKNVAFLNRFLGWLLKDLQSYIQLGLEILIWLGKFEIKIIRRHSEFVTAICDWFHHKSFVCGTWFLRLYRLPFKFCLADYFLSLLCAALLGFSFSIRSRFFKSSPVIIIIVS